MRTVLVGAALIFSSFQLFASNATAFSFAGFSLGMSRAEADAVRPEIAWKEVMRGTPSEAVRKEFPSRHLGHEAIVTVDLSPSRAKVGAIGFEFRTPTDQQCIREAVETLVELRGLYGNEVELYDHGPSKAARWMTANGTSIRWIEVCAVGAQRYVVTYVKD